MSSDCTFRIANLQDADVLSVLARQSFLDAFGPYNDADKMRSYLDGAFNVSQVESEIEDPLSHFLLAEIDSKLVGYSKLNLSKGHRCVEARHPAEIERIYLDQSVIGRGLGLALLDRTLSVARDNHTDVIWLGVWEKNDRAIKFYLRNGFSESGSHVFDFEGELQTDLIMIRPIN